MRSGTPTRALSRELSRTELSGPAVHSEAGTEANPGPRTDPRPTNGGLGDGAEPAVPPALLDDSGGEAVSVGTGQVSVGTIQVTRPGSFDSGPRQTSPFAAVSAMNKSFSDEPDEEEAGVAGADDGGTGALGTHRGTGTGDSTEREMEQLAQRNALLEQEVRVRHTSLCPLLIQESEVPAFIVAFVA